MTLIVHGHPFSSYCQKVTIAFREAGKPFEWRLIADAAGFEALRKMWSIGLMPVVTDGGATLIESSIRWALGARNRLRSRSRRITRAVLSSSSAAYQPTAPGLMTIRSPDTLGDRSSRVSDTTSSAASRTRIVESRSRSE